MVSEATNPGGLRALVDRFNENCDSIPHWLLAMIARVSVATVFWNSARTKVDGFSLRDSTFYLFENEYALPLVPFELAAYMATIAEHVFSVLLFVGLASRLSALALLLMTIVIQVFVYPNAWPTHIFWVMGLAYVIGCGPGPLAIDRLIAKKIA